MMRSKRSAGSHTAREALDAVAVARAIFERYSFDLIYARPGQTPALWEAELTRALAEAGEHLSLYQLTIEQETPFFALHAAGKLIVPDDDTSARSTTPRRRCAPPPGFRPTRFPTMRARERNAGTIWSTGARRNMPASAPARMAGSTSTASAGATATEKRPGSLADAGRSGRTWRRDRRGADAGADVRRFLLMGLRLAEGVDPSATSSSRPALIRSASRSCRTKAQSRPPPTAGCG